MIKHTDSPWEVEPESPQPEDLCPVCERLVCVCPPEPAPTDVRVQNEGTIFVLWPITEAAADWIAENISGDATMWGGGTVVEHRYVGDILEGMIDSGLIVS